MPNKYKTQRY